MRIGYIKQLQDWRCFGIHRYVTCTYITFWKFYIAWNKKSDDTNRIADSYYEGCCCCSLSADCDCASEPFPKNREEMNASHKAQQVALVSEYGAPVDASELNQIAAEAREQIALLMNKEGWDWRQVQAIIEKALANETRRSSAVYQREPSGIKSSTRE